MEIKNLCIFVLMCLSSKEILLENSKCYPETPYAISKFSGELYTKFYNEYYI